jgi:hypothetical protein
MRSHRLQRLQRLPQSVVLSVEVPKLLMGAAAP